MELKSQPSKKKKITIKILKNMRTQVQSSEFIKQAIVTCWWGSLGCMGQSIKLTPQTASWWETVLKKWSGQFPRNDTPSRLTSGVHTHIHSYKHIHTHVHMTLQSQMTQLHDYGELNITEPKDLGPFFIPKTIHCPPCVWFNILVTIKALKMCSRWLLPSTNLRTKGVTRQHLQTYFPTLHAWYHQYIW